MSLPDACAYIDSLGDGRDVRIGGERVRDVARHPAFRNAALTVGMLYDTLHGERRDVLTAPLADGSHAHRCYLPAATRVDLSGMREAIRDWSRLTFGFMGRTPDYKAAFMTGMGVGASYYGPFEQNARDWHARFVRDGLFLGHAIIDPPFDRSQPSKHMREVFVHAVRDDDRGITVRGVKMLATGAALCHGMFVASIPGAVPAPGEADELAIAFIVHAGNPGLKILCRPSFEARATHPFDAPLSSRFDENDAVLVFDDALIPWEDVLVYRDAVRARGLFPQSGFLPFYNLHAATRFSTKLDFMTGMLARATRANGTADFRATRAALGELVAMRRLVDALGTAMIADAALAPCGALVPGVEPAMAMRVALPGLWRRARDLLEGCLGGSALTTPATAADLRNQQTSALVNDYYAGGTIDPAERVKLFKLVWDTMGSEFGSRQGVYEQNYSGNFDQIRLDTLAHAEACGTMDRADNLVETCMAAYDIHGWVASPWAGAS